MKKLTVIAMLLACIAVYTQEPPKAIEIDEFGKITCEDLLARTDSIQIQLSNNPTSAGLVIITPQKGDQKKARSYKNLIEGFLQRRDFDMARIKIYQAAEGDAVSGSLWLLPAGAELPMTDLQQWPPRAFDLSKPFIFDSESDELICETFAPKLYAELIKSNPHLRGHIVIYPQSRRFQRETASKWLRTFTSNYKVPRKRLRFFYAKESDLGYVEFWIVPIRREKASGKH